MRLPEVDFRQTCLFFLAGAIYIDSTTWYTGYGNHRVSDGDDDGIETVDLGAYELQLSN